MNEKKERIWELDALRGLCLLGMIAVHLCFDLQVFGRLYFPIPAWFRLMQEYGHILFILISGICATLATRTVRRGLIVFGAGLLVSYVTLMLEFLGGFDGLGIWFGILHLLGLCMLVYPLFRRLPFWALLLLGTAALALGVWMQRFTVGTPFLLALGLRGSGVYLGADYFPVFPNLGWFLIGAALGKTLYRRKASLLPRVSARNPVRRALCLIGRHSLELYLLHQPILAALVWIFS